VRGFEVVVGVIVTFFVIGIGVGALLVIALPVLRRRRGTREVGWDRDYRRPYGPPPGYSGNEGPGWEESPGREDDDNPPRWPGRRG
jgi:hypothetical protein